MEDGSKQALDSPKDNPKEPVDNTIVWIQSFIPAIGAVFKFGTLVMILINCILLTVDSNNLEKSGYDVTPMGNPWFVPVYLYKRAQLFGHSNVYFIVWCVTFGLSCMGFFR